MKQVTFLAALITLSLMGCGRKDVIVTPDGSSAVINKEANGSTQVNATDNKGNAVTENIGKDGSAQINTTDKDGNKVSETIDKNGMSMKDSKGESMTMSAGAVTEDILGVPFYPGSQEAKNGMTMVTDTPEQKGAMSTRTTPDAPDKVTAFYQDKLTNPNTSSSNAGDTKVSSVSGKLASGADIAVVATKKGSDDTQVMVTMGLKKTK